MSILVQKGVIRNLGVDKCKKSNKIAIKLHPFSEKVPFHCPLSIYLLIMLRAIFDTIVNVSNIAL